MLNNKKGISLMVLVLIIALVVIVGVVTVTFVMNKNNPSNDDNTVNSNSTNKDNTNTGSNSSTNLNFSQTMKFVGYNIAYPSDASKNSSDYGWLVGTSEYTIIVEAPATAGIIKEVSNINDTPAIVEQYIFETLEHKVRSLFDFDSTEQIIKGTSKTTKNGIEMLRTEGVFKNTRDNTEVEFVSYYLLAGENGNIPVYIVGIPMKNSTVSVKEIIDQMSSHITK